MLHLTGAALLLAASALLRRAILSRARQQRQTLRVLSDGFLSLAQAVRATLAPFPALLETVPREGAAGMFFSSVRALLSRGETLSDAWRTAAEALPPGSVMARVTGYRSRPRRMRPRHCKGPPEGPGAWRAH